MTNQQAIERIKLVHCWTDINNNPTVNSYECSLYMNNDGLCEDCEYHIALECIEKQIPKKPNGIYIPNCPTCGSEYGLRTDDYGDNPKHCTECGQTILWGSDNE